MEMLMSFFGRHRKNCSLPKVLHASAKFLLTSKFVPLIIWICLLLSLLVFGVFSHWCSMAPFTNGYLLPKISSNSWFFHGHCEILAMGIPLLFHRGQTPVPAMWWKMQKNEASGSTLELWKVLFCWLFDGEKRFLILRCIYIFSIAFCEPSA